MAGVAVAEFVSLDGVTEAPGGEPGYRHTGCVARFPDSRQFKHKFAEVPTHEALLIGRSSCEGFAAAPPSMENELAEFAVQMNRMPQCVASTTLKAPQWNNPNALQGDTARTVAKLKQELQGDILVAGSRTVVNPRQQNDLTAEYRLPIFPIILGSGMRPFTDAAEATTLERVDSRSLESGSVILTHRPARGVARA